MAEQNSDKGVRWGAPNQSAILFSYFLIPSPTGTFRMSKQIVCEIGDLAWMMINGEPQRVKICALNIICNMREVTSIYIVRHGHIELEVPDTELYRTKEELLKSL